MTPNPDAQAVRAVGPEVEVPAGDVTLAGNLGLREERRGLVVFAHGSGSSRFSPRNRFVAGVLQEAGLSTLLFDLLTEREEKVDLVTRELRFDIEVVPGATHLFEEEGKLERVAELARDWFVDHLGTGRDGAQEG